MELPYNGEYLKAEHKKFREVVVVVPFFGGKKPQLRRHAEFLNNLGYDCVLFELVDKVPQMAQNLISSSLQFGMKHVWADQIENILNRIPQNKIIFAFSNPCASAIEAIARRKASDIKGLVCDGGPSSQLWSSMMNYFTHEDPLRLYPVKALASTMMTLMWHPKFKSAIHQDLVQFPEGFRILSIRGWKDKLITPQMIDQVFEPHVQLEWQKLSLPQAGHLNGLKDFKEDYEPAVAQFLKEVSSAVKTA